MAIIWSNVIIKIPVTNIIVEIHCFGLKQIIVFFVLYKYDQST